jgi:hypothetical protein
MAPVSIHRQGFSRVHDGGKLAIGQGNHAADELVRPARSTWGLLGDDWLARMDECGRRV